MASLALGASVLIGAGLAGRSGGLPELSVAERRAVEPGRAEGLSLGTAEIFLPPTTPSRPGPDPVVVLGDEIVAGPEVGAPVDEPTALPVRVRTPAPTVPPAPTTAPPTTSAPEPPTSRPPATTPPPTTAGPAAPPTTVDAHGEGHGKGLGHVKAKGKGHQKHHGD